MSPKKLVEYFARLSWNQYTQQINVDTSLFSYGYGCLVFLSLFSGTSVLSYVIAFMFP